MATDLTKYQQELLPHFKLGIFNRTRNNPIELKDMPEAFEKYFERNKIKMKKPTEYDCREVAKYLSHTGYPIAKIYKGYYHCRLPQDLNLPIDEKRGMIKSLHEEIIRMEKVQSRLSDGAEFTVDGSIKEAPMRDYSTVGDNGELVFHDDKSQPF